MLLHFFPSIAEEELAPEGRHCGNLVSHKSELQENLKSLMYPLQALSLSNTVSANTGLAKKGAKSYCALYCFS